MPQAAIMHTARVRRHQTHHFLKASRPLGQERTVFLERDHIRDGFCDIDIVLHEAPTPLFKDTQRQREYANRVPGR